jgi:ferrochelatase
MTAPPRRVGVLLANVGTPDARTTAAVRRYLAEFLMDGRVIDIPAPLRWLLVHGIILRTRPKRSAAAYRAIWTERGSPLLLHSEALASGLRQELGEEVAAVAIGMRYANPSLAAALDQLAAIADEIAVVPLFPQYSAAAWATVFDAVAQWARTRAALPALQLLPPFHDHPGVLDAAAAVARPHLQAFAPDRVLMSFHGLPEAHVRATDRSGGHCLVGDCCAELGSSNAFCYRAQCYSTARALAKRLSLADERYEVAFQSRLTRAWIQPFTDHRLPAMAKAGVKRLAVLCPAFVADCLETLEEIGIRARAQFRAAGGDELLLVPCVNSDPQWVKGLAAIVRERLPRAT